NNLEDIPTDEPLYGMPNSTSSVIKGKKADKQLTNWFDSVRLEISKQSIIDEAITLAFIMCAPSCEILSGWLLDIEVAKVINK
ncbi:13823_t:CDS:2, partial [Gigaspora margarita]